MENTIKYSQKIIFLRGLPASGKSTWAKQFVIENAFVGRINKDDIREELGNPKWSQKFEDEVLELERKRGIEIIENGFSLIVDDTNFADKHSRFWENIAKKYKYQFVEKFFDTPLEECIARDLGREKPVGEQIIRSMYNKYLRSSKIHIDDRIILPHDPKLPHCIIVDIDGTLALHNGRNPYDYKKCDTDLLNQHVANIVKSYSLLYDYNVMESDGENCHDRIFIISGRDGIAGELTEKWLDDNFIPYDRLFMRTKDDRRSDNIIKREIYEKEIKGKYNVEFVLDDRDSVVQMWRELGLLCLQVYYGNF